MADIVKSSAKPGKSVMREFKKLVETTNAQFKQQLLSPLTITLGDEFQGVVNALPHAIEIIFFLDEKILSEGYKLELRYVINYGKIDTAINPERAYEMLGSGLTHARELLERSKEKKIKVQLDGLKERKNRELNLAFSLYQSIVEDWPLKDHKAVSKFIELKDYKLVAKSMKKDISTAWRKERTLKMKAYFDVKSLITSMAE